MCNHYELSIYSDRDVVDSIAINEGRHSVVVDGNEETFLTPIEYDLLMSLVMAKGDPVSKQKLIADAWGDPWGATELALKTRINSLRQKIGKNRVENVYGYGYRIVSGK